MGDEELSADHAWRALRRYGGWCLVRDAFVRFRYGDGFSHARAVGLQLCLAAVPFLIALTGLAGKLGLHRGGRVVADTILALTPGASESLVSALLSDDERRRDVGEVALFLGLVNTDRGPLSVISTHLYPYSGWRRLREARWLASVIKREATKREATKRERAPGGMVLLMGDLNSLDPWTDHGERLQQLPPRYRSRHLRRGILTPHNRRAVDTRAVAVLADAGFVDLFRPPDRPVAARTGSDDRDYTAPTERGGGAEFSRMRLDYILGTEAVVPFVRTCRIVWGGEAENASDHYPVVAEFDLRLM